MKTKLMTLKNIVSKTGGIENFTKNVSSELKKQMVLFSHVPLPATEKWIAPVCTILGLVVAVAVIAVVIWQYWPRGYRRAAVEENPGHRELPLAISTERDETAQES